MDAKSLAQIATAHPAVLTELNSIYAEICHVLSGRVFCRFNEVLRTFEKQAEYYAQSRTTPGPKVTDALPGQSYHQYGLAVDIVLCLDTDGDGKYEKASWDITLDFDKDGKADWMEVVAIFKKYGWGWGGDWKKKKDYPHFEKSFGYTYTELKALYDAGDFVPGANAGSKYVRLKQKPALQATKTDTLPSPPPAKK